jgi:hypothetical protein
VIGAVGLVGVISGVGLAASHVHDPLGLADHLLGSLPRHVEPLPEPVDPVLQPVAEVLEAVPVRARAVTVMRVDVMGAMALLAEVIDVDEVLVVFVVVFVVVAGILGQFLGARLRPVGSLVGVLG